MLTFVCFLTILQSQAGFLGVLTSHLRRPALPPWRHTQGVGCGAGEWDTSRVPMGEQDL